MSEYGFSGSTYCPTTDAPRLSRQLDRVRDMMSDGQWRTLAQIATATGCSEASASARLRDLRKARFGGHTVERRRVPGGRGLHLYRLEVGKC